MTLVKAAGKPGFAPAGERLPWLRPQNDDDGRMLDAASASVRTGSFSLPADD